MSKTQKFLSVLPWLAALLVAVLFVSGMARFWSIFQADEWTAIFTMILALVTTLLCATATWQLLSLKRENMKNRTLEMCNKYDNDPIIDAAAENIFQSRLNGEYEKNPKKLKKSIVTILNYLDSIAIGIQQGLYIDDLAKDHLNEILQSHVRDFLESDAGKNAGVGKDNYPLLLATANRWRNHKTSYHG